MAKDNKSLGRFHLVGIPPAPRGVPQIEVTFDIDANGILNVSAKDRGTGQEQKITITGSSGLNDQEIQEMVKNAESHAEDDRRKKEEIEARNRADNMIYSCEKLLRDNREKVGPAEAKSVEEAISKAKQALESGDVDRINASVEDLTQASHKLAEVIYQSAQAQPGPEGGQGGPTGSAEDEAASSEDEGEVIDAEYVDVDDKK